MTTATLTDRYIDAAMRTVPEKQRTDLGAELRASIEDQIDARMEEGMPRDAAERVVLTELGDPEKLAADYTDRPLWLIGPRYYLEWWRLLKLLLFIVPPFAAFGVALGKTLSGAAIGDIVGTAVLVTMSTIVHLAFWTTLVFVLVERGSVAPLPAMPSLRGVGAPGLRRVKTASLLGAWTPDQLPEPQQSGATFADLVAKIVFLVIGVGAILWDQFIGFVPTEPGLSFLDPGLWPWWVSGLFVVMAVEAVLQLVVFLRGRWTFLLASVAVVLNIAVAAPALWLLSRDELINPEFWPTVVPDDGSRVGQIIAIVAGFGIVAIAVWDSVDSFLKARRSR